MPGTQDTLRSSTSIPDRNKRRSVANSSSRPPKQKIPKDKELTRLRKKFGTPGAFTTDILRRTQELFQQREAGPTGGESFATRRASPPSPVAGPRPVQPLRSFLNRPRRFVPESASRRFIRGG